jgi:hypothetical protein
MAAEQPKNMTLDQLTVRRINVVEPDGTLRLVIADKAEFPGGFIKGRELHRTDRSSAGMLFMNNEGTENGGLLFGGYQSKDGETHSYGHLSFDAYEQDQAMSIDFNQNGARKTASYQINDNATGTLFTPEVLGAFDRAQAMPSGPERQQALKKLQQKYPVKLEARSSMAREADGSAVLRLRDASGRTRILLRVTSDGTPSMEFLDAAGKVTRSWTSQ